MRLSDWKRCDKCGEFAVDGHNCPGVMQKQTIKPNANNDVTCQIARPYTYRRVLTSASNFEDALRLVSPLVRRKSDKKNVYK